MLTNTTRRCPKFRTVRTRMRRLIYSTILAIALVTVWMLYLKYDIERFMDIYSVNHTSNTPSVDTVDIPEVSEDDDSIPTDSALVKNITNSVEVENEHTHPHSYADNLEETNQSNTSTQALLPTEKSSHLNKSIQKIDIEDEIIMPLFNGFMGMTIKEARETREKIMRNPDIWIKGGPGEIGSEFVLMGEDSRAFAKAIYVLYPSKMHRSVLEQVEMSSQNGRTPKNYDELKSHLKSIKIVRVIR